MGNPKAAMLVIGDEILSGRTRDANIQHLAERLTAQGIDLTEVRIVSDDHDVIISAVQDLSRVYAHVFTSGGIGPTHDDITAESVAAAFGVGIDVRDDARAILEFHYDRLGSELNEARLRMARIPDGADLIDNAVSFAPGFTLQNVHVMAGVPKIFSAMLDSLLPKLQGGSPVVSQSRRIERPEGEIAGPLGKLAEKYPDLSIGCYPFSENGVYGANIVVRGNDEQAVAVATNDLVTIFPEAT
jgi:molybdenum cofactor synthesis domain-containing protein